MNSGYDSLKLWLDTVSPGSFQPLDTEYNLVWKLCMHYGALPAFNDSLVLILAKLFVALSTVVGGNLVDEASNLLVDESGNHLVWY